MDKRDEPFAFQSVAIVRKDHTGGLNNLRGVDFCHPGLHYERHQLWTEKVLKHFERTVVPQNCSFDGISPAEVEAAALSEFFNAACRPGSWSNDPQEDRVLKEKYTKLCALCDDPTTCSYKQVSSSHRQALECVRKSGNAITYVALQEAKEFFNSNVEIINEFAFLCMNGSLQAISTARPCVWISQPWKLIVSNNEKAIGLAQNIGRWMSAGSGWESSLKQILIPDSSSVVAVSAIVSLPDYIG